MEFCLHTESTEGRDKHPNDYVRYVSLSGNAGIIKPPREQLQPDSD